MSSVLLLLTGCLVNTEVYLDRKALLTDDDGDGLNELDGDCNDNNPNISAIAPELCNGRDDNCDDLVDNDVVDGDTWYSDGDGDGFGPDASEIIACKAPGSTWVNFGEDCDDNNSEVFPGADEHCNNLDDDCDGETDETPTVNTPIWYLDTDGDGYGTKPLEQCIQPAGYAELGSDCNDKDAAVFPGADEYCNDNDDDCDGAIDEAPVVDGGGPWYDDVDEDGYGDEDNPQFTCTAPEGTIDIGNDCEDAREDVNPDATEICNDGIDNDCDGTPNECVWDTTIDMTRDSWSIDGRTASDNFAKSGAIGDINGNGTPEVILSAFYGYDETSGERPGMVFIFEGPISSSSDWSSAQIQITGSEDGSGMGSGLAVSDLDGDGYDDLIVGGYGVDYKEEDLAGSLYIFYGPTTVDNTASNADWTITNSYGEGTQFGRRLNSIGDIDGDGKPDFASGATTWDYDGVSDSGAVLLFTKNETGISDTKTDSFALIYGVEDSERLGRSFTGSDFNGDGVDDFVVGSYGVEIISAFFGDVSEDIISVEDADIVWNGEEASYGLVGYKLDSVGDLNEDGLNDLIIGASQVGDGASYIVYGATSISGYGLADAPIVIRGTRYPRNFGYTVHGVGDVNGDGSSDIVIGEGTLAPNDLYVFYGPLSGKAVFNDVDADVILTGDAEEDTSYDVALGPGDLTGDSVPDLVIGSYQNDLSYGEEVANAGTAYIIPGIGL